MSKRCLECGSENIDTAKFCEDCGAKLKSNGLRGWWVNRNIFSKTLIIIFVLFFGLILVGAIGSQGDNSYKSPPSQDVNVEKPVEKEQPTKKEQSTQKPNLLEYVMGGSKFQLDSGWKQTWNAEGSDINRYHYEKDGFYLEILQYHNLNLFNSDRSNAQTNHQSKDISGVDVTYIETSTFYDTSPNPYPTYLFYFQKNGKYFTLSIHDSKSDKNKVNTIANQIISTLQ